MGQYSIKDLEILTGIKAHTLRIWEQRYGIVKPERTETNIRYYTDSQLKKILNISLLNNSGVKISKIASMSEQELNSKLVNFDSKELIHDKYINDLVESMIEMDRKGILSVMNKHQEFENLEEFFMHVIFPYMNKVGRLWTANSINPAQEHFASNIIKRYLVNLTESLKDVPKDAPLFILLLPEGDWHELSLLLAENILKQNGKKILYLGASVPEMDLSDILNRIEIESVLCVGILSRSMKETQAIINRLCYVANSSSVYFAGKTFYKENLVFPSNGNCVKSFTDLTLV